MPFMDRPEHWKIPEGIESMDRFMLEVLRLIEANKPYGAYVVLCGPDAAHGYQFGLEDEDFKSVADIAIEHGKMEGV